VATIDKNIYGEKELVDLVRKKGLMMDVDLYEQILYNVLSNACKFNKVNGQIKVSF